jgi:hypothetical protein
VASIGVWANLLTETLQTSHGRRGSVLNRVAVFAAAPRPAFLTLLLELLLSFGIGKAEVQLDATRFIDSTVEVLDYALCNFAGVKTAKESALDKRS